MAVKGEIRKHRGVGAKTTRSVNIATSPKSNIELASSGVWVWTGLVKSIDMCVLIDELRDERTDIIMGKHE